MFKVKSLNLFCTKKYKLGCVPLLRRVYYAHKQYIWIIAKVFKQEFKVMLVELLNSGINIEEVIDEISNEF